jgi:Na+(H+)/acetate symporter ActP
VSQTAALAGVVVTVVATLAIGAFGLRISRTTSDFYVASRSVTPRRNGAAVSGEYLSGASFLGVAGLVLAYGVDMLWYPVGYAVGYLVVLTLVAAPLRRSGAYTLPDFAEARLESHRVRLLASVLVVLIGWLYLLPQFQAAGLVLRTVFGVPTWVGPALVAGVVLVNVVSGGMRSITLVQAFQYWLKLLALALPLVFLAIAWRADGAPPAAYDGPPVVRQDTVVRVGEPVTVDVATPLSVDVTGVVDGRRVDGPIVLEAGEHRLGTGTELDLPAGSEVPLEAGAPRIDGGAWLRPVEQGREHALYWTLSLMVGLFFGTMGLPHVLVRFYTNPDGAGARRTTFVVLGLLGLFYLLPGVYGALGRLYAPDTLVSGPETAVLVLPGRLVEGSLGDVLTALVMAGAFAAFLSTSSGLAVSVSGVLSQDLLHRRMRSGVGAFRVAACLAVVVPFFLALGTERLSVANVVGLVFAVAASTFSPLLLLGIWWRGLTAAGATAGMLAGGGLSLSAIVLAIAGLVPTAGWLGSVLAQPAAVTVPVALLVMVVVSFVTKRRLPREVARTMVRLHTPETVELDRGDWRPLRPRSR